MLQSLPRTTRSGILKRAHVRRSSSTVQDLLHSKGPVDIHPEVLDALEKQRPVVALETTIVTHGMPHPINLKTARSVESIVRSTGAIPATIGILSGRVKIGLEPHELEHLADVERNPSVVKVSRRDIGPTIALKRDGGTTCSATLIFAALAGIKVFATGGLGGVHRGGESSMDVSADLHELTRCPVGLVSAGVKSILDIGRTLEYLETLGVPVVTYGDTNDFPAFYTRRSGFKSPWRVIDSQTAAHILHHQRQLDMKNGVLFGVPIPEQYQAIGEKLQEAVDQAVREADENGVNRLGKEATPWLLKRVGELTAGKSLQSNVALIENTALVGGQIAVAYEQLQKESEKQETRSSAQPSYTAPTSTSLPTRSPAQSTLLPPAKLVVFGSAAVDITAQGDAGEAHSVIGLHTTVPGTVSLSLGGVGRNVAEAAHRVLSSQSVEHSTSTVLISPVGDDSFGRLLTSEMERAGLRTDGLVTTSSVRTAICNMVLDGTGSLTGGVADMNIIHQLDKQMATHALAKHSPQIVALDGNLSQDTLSSVLSYCIKNNMTVYYEPTSVPKSVNIFPAIAASLDSVAGAASPVSYAAPNILELGHMYQEAVGGLTAHDHWWKVIDDMALGSEFRTDLELLARLNACDHSSAKGTLAFLVDNGIAQMSIHLLPFFHHLIIKCGDRGVVTVFRVAGEDAQGSSWLRERTNVRGRYVVGRGKWGKSTVVLQHFPAMNIAKEQIVNVTGTGDSLVGSMLATLLQNPAAFQDPTALQKLVTQAQRAAVLTLQSNLAVAPALSTIRDH